MLIAALALAGCGDPTAPLTTADVTATYVLASLNGANPPVPFGEGTTIIVDTISFRADSTWQSATWSGIAGGGTAPTSVGRYGGTWRLDPSRATLYRRTPNAGALIETPFAVLDGGRRLEYATRTAIWRYVRVP